jgi:hypothetical protein
MPSVSHCTDNTLEFLAVFVDLNFGGKKGSLGNLNILSAIVNSCKMAIKIGQNINHQSVDL